MAQRQTFFFAAVLLVLVAPLQAHHGQENKDGIQEDEVPAASPVASQLSPLETLKSLGVDLLGSGAQPEFLDPNVAYVLNAGVPSADRISVRFDIADEYYLYRDKFRFYLEETPGVELVSVDLAPGVEKFDEFFGQMMVFYDEAVAELRLARTRSDATDVSLEVSYQGCADAGLCYPPITKTVSLLLPPSTVEEAPSGEVGAGGADIVQPVVGTLPEQDRIARSLASGSPWLILALFFGFGLLLTFTPCVFPMIPILSSIIVGQGETLTTRKAFLLSLTYVLAMAATYTAAGVIAGKFGANLQAMFQDPRVLSIFSAVFVLLALSMFGFYDLQIPAAWQSALAQLSGRRQGGTYIGVGLMGLLSALIVGPCVAAPLAGALIYISQTGDALLGGMALFALSMGMGTPVLAVGTSAGKLLPKAGPWMKTVKAVFGVLLLAVAIYLIERIIPGWIAMLLWAALLIVSAIYVGAFDSLRAGASGWQRFRKGAGLVTVVYGVLLMVGAAGGGEDPLNPLRGASFGSDSRAQYRELDFKPVKGLEGLREELRLAAARGRPVMLDYYADWCVSCKELERYTFSDPRVQATLSEALVLRTDVTANDEQDQALLREFGLFGPPAILFFGPDGKERSQFRVVGFVNAERFRAHVTQALNEGGSRSAALTKVRLDDSVRATISP